MKTTKEREEAKKTEKTTFIITGILALFTVCFGTIWVQCYPISAWILLLTVVSGSATVVTGAIGLASSAYKSWQTRKLSVR